MGQTYSVEQRSQALAQKIKDGAEVRDFTVDGWCDEFPLFDYQLQGLLWMYLTPKAILADSTGLGKTIQCLALLTMLKEKGKLSHKNRAIIIVPAISVHGSWQADGFEKFKVPLNYRVGRGTPKQRQAIYEDDSWEVLLTNYETVRQDVEYLLDLGFKHMIMDEADYIRNHATKTAKSVKAISKNCDRVVAVTATPIQNSLLDLHSILEALGLNKVFGSKTAFDRHYHEHEVQKIYTKHRTIYKKKVIGYKNVGELKKKLSPYYLRRTYSEVKIKTPELKSQPIWLDMTKEQAQLYGQIQNGFAKLTPDSPPKEINDAVLRLRQVCTGTETLGASIDESAKLDWLMHKLETDWAESKVVVFSTWKATIATLEKRLGKAGIGWVTMTGDESQKKREVKRQQFWNDDNCRVLIGTTAIDRSLNLHCANIQVNMDMLYNPSRHKQLAGRVARVGSIHDEAWVFSLMCRGTIEEAVMKVLQTKQAVSDAVFDEASDIFEKLSVKELARLIRS